MRKFTKLLLTLALLCVGVGANATKLNADLSKLSSPGNTNATWDGTTKTITWTGKSNNMISNFDFAAGDYKQYTTIGVAVTSLTNANFVRVQIRANGQEKTCCFEGTEVIEKSLTTDFGFTVADLEHFEWARLLGSNWDDSHTINADNTASAVISEVYLESSDLTKEVDLSTMSASSGTATWDKETGIFTWTGTWSNSIALPGLKGDLSAYTTINYETVKTSESSCDHFRILIYYSNGKSQTTYQASVGTKSITFASMGVEKADLAYVSSINIAGASDMTGDMKITSVSLSGPAVNYIEATTTYSAPAGTTDLDGMTGDGDIKWNVSYPKDLSPQTSWLGSIDNDNSSINIENCNYLHFVVTNVEAGKKLSLRVFVSEEKLNDNSKRHILYPHLISEVANVGNWEAVNYITTSGTYVVDISGYPLLRGFKGGNGFNGDDSNGTITVSMAYLSSGSPVDYVPSGRYTLVGETPGASALTAALADASATYFDATGVTGTNVDLTPTGNPNALFKANNGVLANTKNVIVGSVCDNLELTDAQPFKAPAAFTATNAKFTKTVGAADYATMVIPFAAALPSGVEAYTITDANDDTGVLTFTPAESIAADAPVLLKNAGTYEFSATGVEIAATEGTVRNSLLKGAYTATTAAASPGNYVLQNNADGVNFYLVTDIAATVPPFRAYLSTDPTGAARTFYINLDEATAIDAVQTKAEQAENGEVYNLAGQRVAQPQKGLYIVNGKKVIVK